MRHPSTLQSGGIGWKNIRVLLFSQDDAFRFLVRQTFRKLSVRDVLSTSVSADATPMMKQGPDIGLVDFDGDVAAALVFLERVRDAADDMPVLVVMRSGEKAGLDEALRLGIEGVVPKLVSGHELTHRVTDTLKNGSRMPVPAPKAKPMAMPAHPQDHLTVAEPGTVGTPPVAGETATLKAELASLAARLGQTIGEGTYGGGGSNGGGDTKRPAEANAGWGTDDLAVIKPAGGTLAGEDATPAAKSTTSGTREALATPAALPLGATAALPLTAKDTAARQREDAAKARWQAELALTGHASRTGSDVAGLDVTAIVAAHRQWLTTKGAVGKRATFQAMDLAGGDLSRAVLANATFREADLSDANLAGSRLDGADFRYAKLGAADLAGANLGVAQMRHADLRLANLQGATMRGADLSGARLGGAKLAGADLGGVMLVGTDLRETDLAQVDNLSQAQLDKAECGPRTRLPPGIFPPRPKAEG